MYSTRGLLRNTASGAFLHQRGGSGRSRTCDGTRTPDIRRTNPLLTVADIAGRIGAHEQTVRGWIKSGELQASKFGSRIGYRIRLGDYEAFLSRRTLTGAIATQHLKGAASDF